MLITRICKRKKYITLNTLSFLFVIARNTIIIIVFNILFIAKQENEPFLTY